MMISSHSLIGLTFFIQRAHIENNNLKFNEKNPTTYYSCNAWQMVIQIALYVCSKQSLLQPKIYPTLKSTQTHLVLFT